MVNWSLYRPSGNRDEQYDPISTRPARGMDFKEMAKFRNFDSRQLTLLTLERGGRRGGAAYQIPSA